METTQLGKPTYYYHLTGLKGLACLLVLMGHYIGLYKYAQSFVPSIRIIDILNNSQLSFLIDEGYWLYLFFVVSGYLVSKSKITSIADLVSKIISRFLRLALPILFSYFIIFIIYLTVGFHTGETSTVFQCQWFQNYYTGIYTIKDVLLGPINVLIFGESIMNGPYWVLQMMFFSSVIIYILKKIFSKITSPKLESLIFSMLFIITIAFYVVSPIITACLVGMLVSFYEDSDIRLKSSYAFWFLLVTMLLYILPVELTSIIFFAALIVFVPRIKLLEVIFLSKPVQYIGKMSWGIYSFHWPIICSFGALFIIKLTPNMGLLQSYVATFVFVLILTGVFSICFYYTLERFSSFLTKKVNKCILQFLKGVMKNT